MYIWYILDDCTMLEEYNIIDKEQKMDNRLTAYDDVTGMLEKILDLLEDDYLFAIHKNRMLHFMSDAVITKFRNILKQYRGKSVELNKQCRELLKASVYYDTRLITMSMHAINGLVRNIKRYN